MGTARKPWSTFPEGDVLAGLLRSSEGFRAFYREERRKIARPVHWAQDMNLPEGIDFRATRIPSDREYLQVIRLRRVPALNEDALGVAHELEHFVLDTEGFPCLGGIRNRSEQLASALTSKALC